MPCVPQHLLVGNKLPSSVPDLLQPLSHTNTACGGVEVADARLIRVLAVPG